jgi:hypothetical protein
VTGQLRLKRLPRTSMGIGQLGSKIAARCLVHGTSEVLLTTMLRLKRDVSASAQKAT